MVGDDTEGNGLLAVVLGVRLSTRLRNGVEQRREDVGVVVGRDALHRHGEALKTHSRVDVLVGKGHEGAVCHAVEFHEHEVPDFNHLRVVFVDQIAAVDLGAFFVAAEVNVDFGARSTRPCLAHLPEVVLFVGRKYAVVGNVRLPLGTRFVIGRQSISLVPAKDSDVQAIFVEPVAVGEQFPRPVDGLGLEVVAK